METLKSSSALNPRGRPRTTTASLDYSPMRPFSRSLPMALLLARESVMKEFRRLLRQHDLTEQQWRVLRALVESEPLEISELARRVCILKPSLTRILKILHDRRLIRRDRSKDDQRFVFISIGKKGRQIFERQAPNSEREYARIEKLFGKKKLGELYDLLNELTEVLTDAEYDHSSGA